MGLMTRFMRLCKADMHGVMDQMEDKKLLLKQCLREMAAGLKEKEERLAQMTQNAKGAERELKMRSDEVLKLEKDLELAVLREKDDISRMLIRKRRCLQAGCRQISTRIEGIVEQKEHLIKTLEQQRLQYDQLKIKITSFGQQSVMPDVEATVASVDQHATWQEPTREEVEFELLQRKEALSKAGAP